MLVTNETTETSLTYVNPDGTITLEASSEPVRVKQGKTWTPIDTSLITADGVLKPKASMADVEFSAGGEGKPFAKLERSDKQSYALIWPSPLPAPKIEGSRATYPDAAGPGADLVLTALPTGFRHDVVLRERPSGPVEYKIPIQAEGLKLKKTKQGGIKLTDDKGKAIALASKPVMYDTLAGHPEFTPTQAGEPRASNDPGGIETQVVSDRNKQTLVLKPDANFLADPATQFPVTVDPVVTLASTAAVSVYSDGDVYDHQLQAGTYHPASGGWKGRTFVRFDVSSLVGQTVTDARLELWRNYVVGCENATASGVEARQVTSAWDRATINWSTQPTSTAQDAVVDPIADPNTYMCATQKGTRSLRLTPIVQRWASGTANHGVVLQGKDETQAENYGLYASGTNGDGPGPKLTVTYGSTPATDRLSVSPSAAASGIMYATSTTPTLRAWINDPDSASLRAEYEVEHDPNAAGQGSGLIWSGAVDNVPANTEAKITVPSGKLADSWKIRWRARAFDNASYSAWSTWQNATVDAEAPGVPAIVCDKYPAGAWSARVTGAYCTAETPSSDGTGYYWGLDDSTTPNLHASQSSGSTVLALPIDIPDGWHTIYVRARDKAHNVSAVASYSLGLGPGSLVSPADKARVQRAVTLATSAPPDRTSVRYYYRPVGDVFNLYEIPPADVTVPGSGAPLTAWPQTRDDTSKNFLDLTWNMAKTLTDAKIADGQIEVMAYLFGGSKPEEFVKHAIVTLDRSGFGSSYATTDLGPGRVALQTGDFAVEASDASLFGISVNRTLTTLAPAADRPDEQLAENKIFGPGWRAGFPSVPSGIADFSPTSAGESGSLQLIGADGATLSYVKDGTTLTGIGDAADGSRITATGEELTVTDSAGGITVYTKVYGKWVVSRTQTPAAESAVTYYRDSQGRVTRILAPVPTDVACTTTLVAGCRALELSYATSTTATGIASGWGDFKEQVKSISFTAFDPESNAMKTTTLASYLYDSTGHLRQITDPRTNLSTMYYYTGEGRISQITPPGLAPWRMEYDSHGRLAHVQREGGDVDPTQAVVYDVPIDGTGAPINLTAAQTAKWGQATDLPVVGAGVFPASHVPARGADGAYQPAAGDWEYASLVYTDVNGRPVNTAGYGAGAWQVSAIRYDDKGNTVWELSPENRAQALTPTANTDSYVAGRTDTADRANLLATISTYNADSDPLTVTDPARQVQLADGTMVSARKLTTTSYDEGKPSSATTYHLATMTKAEPIVLDGTATPMAADAHTVKTGYDPIKSGDPSGWDLRQPTSTTTVMPGGTDIVRKVRYDQAGREIERRQPASGENDAGTTRTDYYSAGAHPSSTECGNKPQWAGLQCRTFPAEQPTGKPLPVTTTTYAYYGGAATSVDTAGTTVRTTTRVFDTAGRPWKEKIEVVPPAEGGAALPESTISYDSATGLRLGITAGTNTLSNTFDSFGRVKTTTDADSNTTTIGYTLDGQVASLADTRGTTTYTYNGIDAAGRPERRGLPTALTAERLGSFTAAFTGDGQLATQSYPNGVTATTGYDSTGSATRLDYAKGTTPWLSFRDNSDIFGEVVHSTSTTGSTQLHTYDGAGRLTGTADIQGDRCTTRRYTLDANSNRAALNTYESNGACTTGTPTTKTGTFDTADRITNTGYSYDALGRTTTVPAADVTGNGDLTVTYHANDMAASLTQNGTTKAYGLDPRGRIRTINTTTAGGAIGTTVNHYTGADDSPSWVAESDGTWTRNILAFNGLAAVERSDNTAQIKLTNLHGDVTATCDNNANAGLAAYYEYAEFGQKKQGTVNEERYGWLGKDQRSSGDSVGGIILMGARLYNPATGRFLQMDPILGGSDNRYEYASQDPINNLDLDGRKKTSKKIPAGAKKLMKPMSQGGKSWQTCGSTYFGFGWDCIGHIAHEDVPDVIRDLAKIVAGTAICAAVSGAGGEVTAFITAACGLATAVASYYMSEITWADDKSNGRGVDYHCWNNPWSNGCTFTPTKKEKVMAA
ncbi:DNRLRE domain-containing protein [Nonomuraea sp. CA-141351]|uniref:DNRLRE domain-containing protein n=1 Tax=Nonomuraea sp. CA-141351 TaxID=3239996 RepID=UPI003D92FF29